MAYKTLIFGTDKLYLKLKPYYEQAIQRDVLEVVATAEVADDDINLVYADGRRGGG